MAPITLNNLKYAKGARGHKRKISGRGFGSNSIRGFKGNKGQGQRITGRVRAGFEGGQTPLYRHVRKIGFNNYEFSNDFNVVTIEQVLALKNNTINNETLKKYLRNPKLPIKLIGSKNTKLQIPALDVSVNKISKKLQELIEKAGGKVNIIK